MNVPARAGGMHYFDSKLIENSNKYANGLATNISAKYSMIIIIKAI
jgi:hypothetical protein